MFIGICGLFHVYPMTCVSSVHVCHGVLLSTCCLCVVWSVMYALMLGDSLHQAVVCWDLFSEATVGGHNNSLNQKENCTFKMLVFNVRKFC